MDMSLLQAIEEQAHRAFILADNCFFDSWLRAIDFRAAVAGLVNVGVGLDLVALEVFRGCRVDGLSEREFESIRFSAHLMDFKRNFAGPDQALKGEWFAAARAPAPVRSVNEE